MKEKRNTVGAVREKAIKAIITGELSPMKAASVFGVHWSTIYKWLQIFRKEGRTSSLPLGHLKENFSLEKEKLVHELIDRQPNITLAELSEKLDIPRSTLQRHLVKLGYVYKKNAQSQGTRARRHKNGES